MMYTGQDYSYNGGLEPYFNRGDGLEYGDGKGGSNRDINYFQSGHLSNDVDGSGEGKGYGDSRSGGYSNSNGHYYNSCMSD